MDHLLKILLMGDASAGKASILLSSTFQTAPTAGEDFRIKDVQVGQDEVKIQIRDTTGLENFSAIITSYCREAKGVMLVYDVSDRKSFWSIKHWEENTKRNARPGTVLVLVGNRGYEQEGREVSQEEGEELATGMKVPFFEVSCKTRENIEEAFTALATLALTSKVKLEMCKRRMENTEGDIHRITMRKEQLSKCIKDMHTRVKGAEKMVKKHKKVKTGLLKQIEKDARRVEAASQRELESRDRADLLEQRERVFQNRVSNLQLRVQQVEGRVADLERQLRRAEGKERDQSKKDIWMVDKDEIELTEEELGRGGWATVCVAKFRGLKVAAKCMHDLIVSEYNRQLFSREMSIAATARHPNLIQFIGATLEGSPIILTELMSTSLRAELERQPLSPDQISSISLDVARALLYLHLMQPDPIIHRDISSANVLLNPGPSNSWLAKVSDYGSANYCRQVKTLRPGNPSYAAPEASTPAQQSTKMDVYSYGVLLLEILSRQLPNDTKHHQGLEREEVREMVQRCLEQDPLLRPDMRDIVEQLQI